MAISMGATIFEKHIGLKTETYSLNKYSANISQTEKWLKMQKKPMKYVETQKMFLEKKKRDRWIIVT